MQISARSYLTAGISLTAASAIALTPLAVPVNDKAVAIPNVTISDIQLTVTPQEIVTFFNNLQLELSAFNADLAAAVALPGQTLVDGLQLSIDFNADFFATLGGLTSNPALLALLGELEASTDFGLASLQYAIDASNISVALTTEELANLLTSTITGSMSNVLSSFVAVLNNPLEIENYTSVLSTGVVATVQLIAENGLSAIQSLGTAGFDLSFFGLELAESQVFNAIDTVAQLMNVASAATGSDLIVAVNDFVQSITLAPAQAISDVAFDVTNSVLFGGFEAGFDEIIGGGQAIVGFIGNYWQAAINAIGAAPLDPESYVTAGGALLASGFYSFDTAVVTAGNVAQIPFNVGIDVTNSVSGALTGLTTGFAQAMTDILLAIGLSPDVANLPLAIAEQINSVIVAGAEALIGGFTIGTDLIEAGTGIIIDVSNSIGGAFGVPPFPPAPPVGDDEDDDSSDPTVARVSAVEDAAAEETEAPAEEATEEVPAEEVPAEEVTEEAPVEDTTTPVETPADEAPAESDDEAAGDADDEKVSKREARAAEREAKKADRESAKESTKADRKTERESKKADKSSDTGSDSSSDKSSSSSSDSGSSSSSSGSDSE